MKYRVDRFLAIYSPKFVRKRFYKNVPKVSRCEGVTTRVKKLRAFCVVGIVKTR